MNWEVYNLPFDSKYIQSIKQSNIPPGRKGFFFKGSFELSETSDTFFDMGNFKKGVVYVNGNNLGRYWEIGPQTRLYCPAPWLKKGKNEIIVFDLHKTESKSIFGKKTLTD
jgi:beta-galactosidase GanA